MQAGLGRGRGARAEGRMENRETWAGPIFVGRSTLLLFSLSMFSRKFQEGQPVLLVNRMNKTKHWEPFVMPKVVVSLVRIRVLVLVLFSDDSLPSSNVTANGQRQRRSDATWIHVSTIFLVLVHAPVAVGYRAQNIARRPVGSLQRDIAVKIFHIVVTLVTSYGKPNGSSSYQSSGACTPQRYPKDPNDSIMKERS